MGRKGPDLPLIILGNDSRPRVQPRQRRYVNLNHVLAVDDPGTAHRRPRHSCTAHVRVPTLSVPLFQK
jgi:hypothetical protein